MEYVPPETAGGLSFQEKIQQPFLQGGRFRPGDFQHFFQPFDSMIFSHAD